MLAALESILNSPDERHCPSIPAMEESLSQHRICVSSATTLTRFLLVVHLEPQRMPGCASLRQDPTHQASLLHPQPPQLPARGQSEAVGGGRAPTAPLVCTQGQKSQQEAGG